jgi:hypothetical protein
LLEKVVELQTQKKAAATESEEGSKAKRLVKANASAIRTIESVVERMLTDELRDFSIENERLKAQVKNSEDAAEITTLKPKS